MSERRIAVITLAVVAAAITGCAHKPVAPPETASQTAAVPAPNTASPAGIVALDKRLTAHHRTLFSVTKDKYSYFIGGVLLAEYEVATRILRISSLEPDKANMVCEYSPQGILYVDPKTHPAKDAFTAGCDQLAQSLSEDLSR